MARMRSCNAYKGERLGSLRAIHKFCVWCQGGQKDQVAACQSELCPLWLLRMGKKVKGESALKTIRKKCLECVGDNPDVVGCTKYEDHFDNPACVLWPYRMGVNPNYSDETRQKRRQSAIKRGFGKVKSRDDNSGDNAS